ncbi:MAG: flagellin [Anaerolineaceae bacterium]|nr:flagellin [Anaerolineaceae bacterium]
MFHKNNLHKDQKGQTALEAAIILIAFIVVASVFAFVILSAGSASTDKSEEAIYSGLEGVQSSMSIKGAIIAEGAAGAVSDVVFTVSLVAGGEPVDMTDTSGSANVVVIGYRDGAQFESNMPWTVNWIVNNDGGTADNMLEDGELAEVTVDLSSLGTALAANTEFTLEIKPPTGAVLNVSRNTPAAIEAVMELR